MYSNLLRLWRLPRLMLQSQPRRIIYATEPRFKLDKENMYEKLKFSFTEENLCRIKDLLTTYPAKERRGALLPVLDLAQRQYGWLPISAITCVAEVLELEPFAVWEVANFYGMFSLSPVGKYRIKVCTTTPCFLRGSDDILEACKSTLALKNGETSKDMQFTLSTFHCMGACVNAPVMAINDDLYEDLTVRKVQQILNELKQGKTPAAGPCSGRFASEPLSGLTTLKCDPPPPGHGMQDICAQKKKPC